MIEADGLTKRYGETIAVNDLSFSVRPGIVTGFLGPNGSGKSTTMRLVLGLDAPTSGDVTVAGSFAEHPAPLHEVGALLEARSVHTGRSAYDHLLSLAQTHGIPRRRVSDLIELVGLERGEETRRPVLPRDGPAARHRRRTARRPGGRHARRARQRPRPRGHPLDSRSPEEPCRRGPDGVPLRPT